MKPGTEIKVGQRNKKRGKAKRAGRRKAQIAEYYSTRYPRNKLRRILDGNGYPAAQSWAAKNACTGILMEIVARRKGAAA